MVEKISTALSFFQMANCSHNLRRHSMRLYTMRNRLDLRWYSFSQRVVIHWNDLPQHVIEAPSHNAFKNRFDKFSDMDN